MSTNTTNRRAKIDKLSRELRLMSSFDALFSQAVAERVGMHQTDIETLDLLNTLGPMTPGQLARRTGLSTGATTRLIDRLERVGFVRRHPDERDRRSVLIVPVWENLGAVGALFLPLVEALESAWSSFDDDQLELATEFVRVTAACLAEVNARLRAGVEAPSSGHVPE